MICRISISVLAVAALGLAACSGPTADPGPAMTPVAQETAVQETAVQETPAQEPAGQESTPAAAQTSTDDQPTDSAPASLDQVMALGEIGQVIAAAEAAQGGTAFKIDDEDDDNAWEVDVLLPDGTTQEVKVDRETRQVLSSKADDDDDLDGAKLPQTTLLDAISAALAHTPGVLDDAELDQEDGQLVWKVEIDQTANGDDLEIYLDAATLQVVKTD